MTQWWVADCDDCYSPPGRPLVVPFRQEPTDFPGTAKIRATEWAQAHADSTGHTVTVREEIR